ncbi:MAG TPA: hypothetical protein VMF08_20955 [Candidatus Sulfotelmatobacter sp.]|nr:hypothetical protein [Candidatus Sulfotelmatobacter sp.]
MQNNLKRICCGAFLYLAATLAVLCGMVEHGALRRVAPRAAAQQAGSLVSKLRHNCNNEKLDNQLMFDSGYDRAKCRAGILPAG